MNNDKDIDGLIARYNQDLLRLREKWLKMGITTDTAQSTPAAAAVPYPAEEETEEPHISSVYPAEEELSEDEDDNNLFTSTALFSADVFAAEEAYPIAGAKISVYRQGKLYAFVMTDENGRSEKISLPCYNADNSLDPESPKKSLDYFAEVTCNGFIKKENILVEAVGSSDIILNVQLTPESRQRS